jgi:hypothetical protein
VRTVRRGALDEAWDVVLADFPVEMWPAIRRYVAARREYAEARGDLTTAKIPYRIEWYELERKLTGLYPLFAG